MSTQVIKPKIRGFVCITAHPEGCAAHVGEQIAYVKQQGPVKNGPKKVLVLGSSTGYGLAARITAAFGSNAATLGVFFEKPSEEGKCGTAGWYNSIAFETEARKAGLYAKSINGDAFSDEMKKQVVELIRKDLGQVDCVVYSLASPRRTNPRNGISYRSTLKPIGQPYTAKNLNTDKKLVDTITLEPASEAEIADTVAVMGGEDWEWWIDALEQGGVLAPGATTMAFSYIGPEVTWPIYKNGAIGKAKEDLDATAKRLNARLRVHGYGRAFVSVNKAVVTQASSAIPVVPLYVSVLFKVMKEAGLHEDCIHQLYRLFKTQAYDNGFLDFDDAGRVRIDDWEMKPEIQAKVAKVWQEIDTANLDQLSDFAGYQSDFLKLFGFGLAGVDYEQPVDPHRTLPSAT